MTLQTNLFYADPNLTQMTTQVVATREHEIGCAIALQNNIVRAGGGGEPRDRGWVDNAEIIDAEKRDGMTWLVLDHRPEDLPCGSTVNLMIDEAHRIARRKLHTAIHVAIRSAIDELGDVNVFHAEIDEDAASANLKLSLERPRKLADVATIDRHMRSVVTCGLPVSARKAKSIENAEQDLGNIFRVSNRHSFRGRVRIICIDKFDANPCSGLHFPTTNIGPYEMHDTSMDDDAELSIQIKLSQTWMYWFGG